jgi:hypothetical protein
MTQKSRIKLTEPPNRCKSKIVLLPYYYTITITLIYNRIIDPHYPGELLVTVYGKLLC